MLQDKLPGKVFAPGSSSFQSDLSTYYSAQESALISACRVSPSCAQDVSDAVAILTRKGCKFAVRSGGHMVWSGAANIDQNGITIDMLDMNSVTVSEDKTVAHVEPGTRLGKVYDTLDSLGLNVVSGRSITVGTGGFMIGGACLYYSLLFLLTCWVIGGISNMSPRQGFGNQNIVGYQVVLSNGTIVETTSVDYPDLFFALHAASTNFGVVTRYDLKTFPFTEYWGGLRLFNVSQAPALINGTISYMDKLQGDPSGLSTLTLGYNGTAGADIALQNFAYLGADGSNADIFSDLLSLPFNPSLNTVRGNIHQQSLYAEIDAAFGFGQRTLFSTFTFKADPQFPLDFHAQAQKAFTPFANTSIFWAINFQPLGIPVLNKAPSNLNPQGITDKNGNLFCESLRFNFGHDVDTYSIIP